MRVTTLPYGSVIDTTRPDASCTYVRSVFVTGSCTVVDTAAALYVNVVIAPDAAVCEVTWR